MLIDDEAIIVEGMRRAVPWEKFDCEVCGTAHDGQSGLELLRQLQPDILFTDICMPTMSGLTMLAALKSEMPRLQTTVLTGFHDFSYAQEAIRLGVVRLLTKPSRMEEIQEAVQTMVKNLEEYGVVQGSPTVTRQTAQQQPQPEENAPPSGQVAGSFIVQQAVAFMEENYAQKLTLQTVADQCYVSQWHLSKLLNRHTEQSFYDLLNAIRIRRAKTLLSDPSLRVSAISEQVGYQDTAHFSRTFKKLEGVSANEYRNRLEISAATE